MNETFLIMGKITHVVNKISGKITLVVNKISTP
jgi:hypothetical protein